MNTALADDADDTFAADRQALLEQRLRGESNGSYGEGILRRPDLALKSPLSSMQRRMWFLQNLMPDSSAYNLYLALRLSGQINCDVLDQSVRTLFGRHQSLRTIFRASEDGEVFAEDTGKEMGLTYGAVDVGESGEEFLMARVSEEISRPFDLAAEPLFRAVLVEDGSEGQVLVLVMHHIIADGWSVGVLAEELHELYSAGESGRLPRLRESSVRYSDFSYWQAEQLRSPEVTEQLKYWLDRLGGEKVMADVPTDLPRPPVLSMRGGRVGARVESDLLAKLNSLGSSVGATLPMTLIACLKALLARLTGQVDIVVGTAVAGRNYPELENIIGLFTNTLVLRTIVEERGDMRKLVGDVRQTILGALANQDVPFEWLVDELEPNRDLSRNPLFQVAFAHQPVGMNVVSLGDVHLTPLQLDNGSAKFDLTLYAIETDPTSDGLDLELEYSADLFAPESAQRILDQFVRLLRSAVEAPDVPVGSLSLLEHADYKQLSEWGSGGPSDTEDTADTVMSLVAAGVKKWPNAIAVEDDEGGSLTYVELWRRSGILASALGDIGTDTLVGICHPRTVDIVVSLLGVLRAGLAYVPLDPDYPRERLDYMIEDSGLAAVLVSLQTANLVPRRVHTIRVDQDIEFSAPRHELPGVDAHALAYVIYTSGSTGRPKGVALAHAGVVAMLRWARSIIEPGDVDRVLAATSICFDLSVYEIFLPLVEGGTVVLAQTVMDVAAGGRAANVTLINTVPSAAAQLLDAGAVPSTVRVLNLAGEQLPRALGDRVLAETSVQSLWNLYGPSESTTYSTYARVVAGELGSPPIGGPVLGTDVYIVDNDLRQVPAGVRGVLCVSGLGLAQSYLRRPALTAGAFLPDPFTDTPGRRMYWTGDVVRWRSDGAIEYLGREDHQIKLNGFRIELGEVEAALDRDPEVRQGVVAVRRIVNHRPMLVAYVEPVAGEMDVESLVGRLRAVLPAYMVPAKVLVLDRLPLNANGKVDRAALPTPIVQPASGTSRAPSTGAERVLAEIWQDLLGVSRIGVDDAFFALGGDSVLSIHMIARARQAGLRVSPRDVFQYQTIAALVANAGSVATDVSAEPRPNSAPLNPMQVRFLHGCPENPHYFNQGTALIASETIEEEALRVALGEVIQEHDALRLRFENGPRDWFQTVVDDVAVPLEVIDLSHLDVAARERGLDELAAKSHRGLDISMGPLLCAVLVRRGPEPDLVLLVIHHLVVDAVSWDILVRDLEFAYRRASGCSSDIRPKATSSSLSWAIELHKLAEGGALEAELPYWMNTPPPGSLPLDLKLGVSTSGDHTTATEAVALSPELSALLHSQLPMIRSVRVDEILLSGLASALQTVTRTDSSLIDVERHGRHETLLPGIDLTRTVGWFTAQFPIYLRADTDASMLDTVHTAMAKVPNQGVGYGALRYLAAVGVDLNTRPEAMVRFNYLGRQDAASLGLFQRLPVAPGIPQDPLVTPSHAIDFDVYILRGQIRILCTRDTRVSQDFVRSLLQQWQEELRALASLVPRAVQETRLTKAGAGITGAQIESVIAELDLDKDDSH